MDGTEVQHLFKSIFRGGKNRILGKAFKEILWGNFSITLKIL